MGVYYGNVYNYNPATNVFPDYTPAQLQSLYGLPTAYKAGFDGTGQTIVLLEAYGYPTIEADANAFNQLTGLPRFTSSNFKIIYPQGPPLSPQAGVLTGWDVEIALDVQWAHSIAPGAKILIVAAAGQDTVSLHRCDQLYHQNHLATPSTTVGKRIQDLFAGPLEEEAFIKCWKWLRPRAFRSSSPAAMAGTGPGQPNRSTRRTLQFALCDRCGWHIHPQQGQRVLATKRSGGAAVLSSSMTREFKTHRRPIHPISGDPAEGRAFISRNPPGKRVFPGRAGRSPTSPRWPIPIPAFLLS